MADEQQDDHRDRTRGAEHDVRVLDTGALKALAHPLRVAIYDILSQFGPQTASSLAERLGESSGATSYHLRALARHDLIREVPDRGTGRERWWERPAGGVSFANAEAYRTPAGRAASQVIMSEFFTRRQEQLRAFMATALDTEPEDWQEAALVSTSSARLTAAQLTDLSSRIQALIDETVEAYRDQKGDGVRPVTIRADLFPIDSPEGEQS